MAKLFIHRDILKNFNRLPSKVQKRVYSLIDEFQADPHSPAIGLHALTGDMLDAKVRGVRKFPDGYRAIVIAPEKGDTYLLVHIDAHDRAYDWARNKRFEVHAGTGVFQVFDTVEVESATKGKVPEARSKAKLKAQYPLAAFSDDELFAAGVPRPLIPAVRSIQSDEALTALIDYLPPDCRDVLYGLAAGMPLDEAIVDMFAQDERPVLNEPLDPGDFSRIAETSGRDLVLVDGQDALKQILAGSLEEWRIFLHPAQRKLVTRQTFGAMNITGAAGTGKTVALMHRAAHLARRLEDPACKVLVTTFTTNLSITIKHHLQRLAPDVADRFEVTNLHYLARTLCLRAGWRGRIAEDSELAQIWEDVWVTCSDELPMSREEMQAEYDLVIDPNGITEEDSYLVAVRSGRPRISRQQRRTAWPVFRAFQRGLKKRNLLTFEGAVHEARLSVEQKSTREFAHVLVDEVQDFSLEALRLIRALSPADEDARDPLCTVGDGHQRIYRTRIPMSRAGIDIRGRSSRLKVNYRTSEQIRQFAQGILRGVEIDDLDEGVASTVGDHSVFSGPEPAVVPCADGKEESQAIVQWVQELQDRGLATHEICVTPWKPEVVTALTAAGIGVYELRAREEDPGASESGIRVGTMKRIKGLEFRAVAIACADAEDAMNQLEDSPLKDRCERYVAATRAREQLLVTVAK